MCLLHGLFIYSISKHNIVVFFFIIFSHLQALGMKMNYKYIEITSHSRWKTLYFFYVCVCVHIMYMYNQCVNVNGLSIIYAILSIFWNWFYLQRKFNTTATHNNNIQTHSQRVTDKNIKVTDKQSDLTVTQHHQISPPKSRRVMNQKVEEIKDQIIRARAYLGFAPPNSNSHLVKELKLRIKEMERAVAEATKDSDLSRR